MKYLLFQNKTYSEFKDVNFLDEFSINKEMFEDIVTLGCSVFADHILFDEEYPCPINDVVFSDEMPIYDFGKTLEEIEHKIYEIRGKFNIDTKRSLDALVREIKEIKKESEDTNKNPDETIHILLDSIKNCIGDNDDEFSREFNKELEVLMQQIFHHEIDEQIILDKIYMLINRTLKIYKNSLNELENLNSIDKKAYDIKILRLGEYKPATRTIVLYYNNIKEVKPYEPESLMKIVFMHELIHALLHPFDLDDNYYFEKLEEPICEYGALCLASLYHNGVLFDMAYEHVANKKKCVPLHHYGFGCYLYDREKLDTDENPCGRFVAALYLQKTKVLTAPHGSNITRRPTFDILIDSFNKVFVGIKDYPRDSQKTLFDKLYKLKLHI